MKAGVNVLLTDVTQELVLSLMTRFASLTWCSKTLVVLWADATETLRTSTATRKNAFITVLVKMLKMFMVSF